jgi:uncharacterized repeat protein (TIGR03803 family)
MTIRRSILIGLLLVVPLLGGHAAAHSLGRQPETRRAPRGSATETIIHSFGQNPDGKWPLAKLLLASSGALYGTTSEGGGDYCQLCGTVFELVPAGGGYREIMLHRFRGHAEGEYPSASIVADKAGDLFGTTAGGGAKGFGTVFEMTPPGAGFRLRTILSFQGTPDAAMPEAALLVAADGALFGTSMVGGYGGECGLSCGTVYKMTPSKSGYSESVIFWFNGYGSSLGVSPVAPLIADPAGIMFGTTPSLGGRASKCSCGAVFSIEPTAKGYLPRGLYGFRGSPDGSNPNGALLLESGGVMFGTTTNGGESCGCGTVYTIKRSGRAYLEHPIYRFQPDFDGSNPVGDLVAGPGGVLYGTTSASHGLTACDCGTVFALTPSGGGYNESVVHAFAGTPHDGSTPLAGLVYDRATNALYGTTKYGGSANRGTAFRIAL